MGTTEPIRNEEELKEFISYYKEIKNHPRNYCLIVMGLNTALRISDILNLQWGNVYDFNNGTFKRHIEVIEHKTGKCQKVIINKKLKSALVDLAKYRGRIKNADYLFSTNANQTIPISRVQAYRIIREAVNYTISDGKHISCHSLRKTFGYHAWKQGAQPALLMEVYNHSSYQITKRYLGINQDEKDDLYLSIEL